jgi:hypothetical protein
MGAGDVLDALARLTGDVRYRQAVEWLGCAWGHPVAPSTPVEDYRLHVRAWQHHFAALFGLDALGRVRGISLAEMALPNQPDVAYAFIKTLVDCGYQRVLVQEHITHLGADGPGDGPDRLQAVIARLRDEDSRFHMEGGSWTSGISWVQGYVTVLVSMERASALFRERVLARGARSDDRRYRSALFHLLTAETSCYRYWGAGIWADYGTELSRRASEVARLVQEPAQEGE